MYFPELDCTEKLSFNKGLELFLFAYHRETVWSRLRQAASGDRAALRRVLWYVRVFGSTNKVRLQQAGHSAAAAVRLRWSKRRSNTCSAMRFFSISIEPPAIIQPRVRRMQYSTRVSRL